MKRDPNRKLLILTISILILNLAIEGSCSPSSFNGVEYTSPIYYECPWTTRDNKPSVSSPSQCVENRIEEEEELEEEELEVASLDGDCLQFHWDDGMDSELDDLEDEDEDEEEADDVEDSNNGIASEKIEAMEDSKVIQQPDDEQNLVSKFPAAEEQESLKSEEQELSKYFQVAFDLGNAKVETVTNHDPSVAVVNKPEESIVIDLLNPAVRISDAIPGVKPQIPISPLIIVSPKSTVSFPPSPSHPPDSQSPPNDSAILQNDVLARVLSNPNSLAGLAFASFMGTLCLSFGVYLQYFVHVF